ncbi:hypothetical protein MMC30_000657 [Trapelia coarctata]|nr:hypothetical protein [Trapelia coarctata]
MWLFAQLAQPTNQASSFDSLLSYLGKTSTSAHEMFVVKSSVKPTISGNVLDKDEDGLLEHAGPYVHERSASLVYISEEEGKGRVLVEEENLDGRDYARRQQDVNRPQRTSSTIRTTSISQACMRPYLVSSWGPPSVMQPRHRSFSNMATRDNLKVSLRLKASTATERKMRASRAMLRAREKEKRAAGRLRTKFIPFRVGRLKARTEQQRVGSGNLPLWKIIAQWTSDFGRINAYAARQAQALLLSRLGKSPSLVELRLKNSFAGLEGQQSSAGNWGNMSPDEKAQLWHPALIHALQSDPETALLMLDDNLTNEGQFFPDYVAKDSLEHLACLYLQDVDDPLETSIALLYRTAYLHLSTYGRLNGSASLSQRTVYLLSKYCGDDMFLSFIDHLQHHKSHITSNSKLHIMERCAQLGKIGIALSLLGTIPGPDLAEDAVQSFCVGLLRADMEVDDLYGLRSNILAYMLKVGVRPNRQFANVIILNAMEAGDLKTAWRSHEIAVENGLLPDVFTYTCLLKGVQRGDHRSKISYVQECAAKDGALATSLRLRCEILYALYVAKGHGPEWRPFLDLLPTYREFFDIQPLIDLGILDHREGPQPAPIPPAPPVQALGLMILAWLHKQNDLAKAQESYNAYFRHVREGHHIIAPLAQTDHTANAFIHAFGCHAKTLPLCTQVIQHMLKSDVADPVKIAPPRVQTWNILLYSFIRNRQAAAAEKVLTIMQSRGHEPNQVTWNTLLGGYASMQDVIGVVQSMKRLEKATLEADSWTMKALNRVVDRAALLEAFERNSEGRPVEDAEDGEWEDEDTEQMSLAENECL